MKIAIFIVLIVIGLFVLLFAWSSWPWTITDTDKGRLTEVEPRDMMETPEHPSVIKVLTYNIGFLYGEGSEGTGYVHREKAFYQKALERVSQEVKNWGADVVFLQEVDFEASRSHDINQAHFIARVAGYPYVAEAVSWVSNYIPFPYWPLKNNFGRMESGGAILSRYPLSEHEVTLLQKPLSRPWWYNLFYPNRYCHLVTVNIGQKKFRLMNLHLEAFDKKNRRLQIEHVIEIVSDKKVDIVAGDFNMLPTSASKKRGFSNEDDYEGDSSYQAMEDLGLQEVIPDSIYSLDEALYFTFPAWAPDRRLDYIWYRPRLKMMKAEILPSASSDHLPLRASFQIDGPRFNPYSQ